MQYKNYPAKETKKLTALAVQSPAGPSSLLVFAAAIDELRVRMAEHSQSKDVERPWSKQLL